MSDTAIQPPVIAAHRAVFDATGSLVPWTSWSVALQREMQFYRQCPVDNGYPRFVYATFLDADWNFDAQRMDTIPATQNGTGIFSYLKYHEFLDRQDPWYLQTACVMGDYLTRETLTPSLGPYASFTRSTGRRDQLPLSADAGSQSDRPYEVQPDKGGLAGYALWLLYKATGEGRYLSQALHNARVLASNQGAGDELRSPWPFRVDYRNAEGRGPVSGNMTYVLRLYDGLLSSGYGEFASSREALWRWIKECQIPSARMQGHLFAQFFEDHDTPTNRTAWAPLNLARYLLEKREVLDPEWHAHCGILIEFVRRNFTHVEFGVTVCHEQDEDRQAWGGVNSTYGAVLALFAKATASATLAVEARGALDFTLYSIDARGRPRDFASNSAPGGWQEDAHTDVIHNYMDALKAFPQWNEAG